VTPCIAGLPLCPKRGLPVPYAAARYPDGTGEFTIVDTRRRAACARHRLCGIGGLALGGEVAFLGEVPPGADPARLVFTDPAMHPECAAASLALCPYIARPRVPRRPAPPGANEPDVPDPAKAGWVLLTAAGYQMAGQPRRGGGTVDVFKPATLLTVRWLTYGLDGQLREAVTGTARYDSYRRNLR
jgi:hypothetical protein